MLESIILWSIIGAAALYVGNKFFKAMRTASDPAATVSCGCSCSDCSVTGCKESKE